MGAGRLFVELPPPHNDCWCVRVVLWSGVLSPLPSPEQQRPEASGCGPGPGAVSDWVTARAATICDVGPHPCLAGLAGVAHTSDGSAVGVVLEVGGDRLSEGPVLALDDTVTVMIDVARGLVHLHAWSPPYVHRAVTLDSIYVTRAADTGRVAGARLGGLQRLQVRCPSVSRTLFLLSALLLLSAATRPCTFGTWVEWSELCARPPIVPPAASPITPPLPRTTASARLPRRGRCSRWGLGVLQERRV